MAIAVTQEECFVDWVGRGHSRQDRLSPRLIEQFRVTLSDLLAPADVPLGAFWTLSPDALPFADLGRDGHPRLGLLLPPLPLPRRMWAGGEISFHAALQPDDLVTRDSQIASIRAKSGSTGPLWFVSVRNDYHARGKLCISERQDLVYRSDPVPGTAAPTYPVAPDLGMPIATRPLLTDPIRLFRFSAITFNGHRIHYDADYARQIEGYPGLVVHGPLQAIALMNLAAEILNKVPTQFSYRGLSPLIVGEAARAEAFQECSKLILRVVKPGGPTTMEGWAQG